MALPAPATPVRRPPAHPALAQAVVMAGGPAPTRLFPSPLEALLAEAVVVDAPTRPKEGDKRVGVMGTEVG